MSSDELSKHLVALSAQISSLKSDVEGLHGGVSDLRSDVAAQMDELRRDINSVASTNRLAGSTIPESTMTTLSKSPNSGTGSTRRKSGNGGVFVAARLESGVSEAFDDSSNSEGEDGDNGNKNDMSDALCIGDIISIHLSEDGPVLGDIRLNNLGVEHLETKGRHQQFGSTPNDAAFRLCPKLNYR
jgi:hypothetical protein